MENEELPRISASQLAEMGYCERKIVLADRFGPRCSPKREQARENGELQHVKFFIETLEVNAVPLGAKSLREQSSIQANASSQRTTKRPKWLYKMLPRWLSAMHKTNCQVAQSVRARFVKLCDRLYRSRRKKVETRRRRRLHLVSRTTEKR